ncbi:Rieske (2Fe-2S) protein [Actinospica acidiphila]|uniref:Rieske (2Fe-2S) protein n=1 Tax=Actinospica acidiphila TaxID=304899 RepID=A0A9X5HCD4_9ACTN|nr:Rieske (2Fe-2S) protein [Actinospica acidiphila]NEC49638.1 Rieske (2Fe-2S) protein [Actinospica acidiphila]
MSKKTGRRLLGQNRMLWLLDALERDPGRDHLIDMLGARVRALPLGRVRDVLHGTWLGHPVHPMAIHLPLGSWMSAAVLDVKPGRSRQADVLVALGLAGAVPAALSGLVDWAELRREQQRVGLVHAWANTAAVGLYGASLVMRLSGKGAKGRILGYLGLTTVGVGGLLGGHLAYRQAAGANHAEEVPHVVRDGWHRVGGVDDFPVGEAMRCVVDDVPVLVVRESGGELHALAERCSHLAGPLSEGTVADGCVRCPWHGSVFRLSDGWNVEGPATAPQPAFDTRVTDGHVEVRLPQDEVPETPYGSDTLAETSTDGHRPSR